MNASALADLRAENARLVEENVKLTAAVSEAHGMVDKAVAHGFELVAEVAKWAMIAKTAQAQLQATRCLFPDCDEPRDGGDMCALHVNVTVHPSFVLDRHRGVN